MLRKYFRENRSQRKQQQNFGVVPWLAQSDEKSKFRKYSLEKLDAYYENRQYAHLQQWEYSQSHDGSYIPIRQRQPRIKKPWAKIICRRLVSKLIGLDSWPTFKLQDPNDEEYIKAIVNYSNLNFRLLEPMRRMAATGAVFVRFYIVNGAFRIQHYLSKYCYPTFDLAGNLEAITIKYVYKDEEDRDESGQPKLKWYKLDLGKEVEILYDNPEYKKGSEPIFDIVSEAKNPFGFVQGEWFRTCEDEHTPDGFSVIEDLLDLIDDFNYSKSQSSQAVAYNQEPTIGFSGMDEEEIALLQRSATKGWNLGREGRAQPIETSLNGVQRAREMRDENRLDIQDASGITLLDPEKISGYAQSGRALELLMGPFVELISEIRPIIDGPLKLLIQKMAMANAMARSLIPMPPVTMPAGYEPTDLNLVTEWPKIIQQTNSDIREKVGYTSQVASAQIVSRETCLRYLAKDFNIMNVEEELAKIAAQPQINMFGGF